MSGSKHSEAQMIATVISPLRFSTNTWPRQLSFTLAKNRCATSEVSNPLPFFENTSWFHTESSMPKPKHQRNSRL